MAWHQVIQLIPGKSWSVLVRHPGDMVFNIPLGLIHFTRVSLPACIARSCRRSRTSKKTEFKELLKWGKLLGRHTGKRD